MRTIRRICFALVLAVLACSSGLPALRGQTISPSAKDTVSTSGSDRRTPVAVAGVNQVVAGVGVVVQLDGSSSSDPAGQPLDYQWAFIQVPDGSTAPLSAETTATPRFVPDRKGRYRVELVVGNGTRTSRPDVVDVTVRNSLPVASAGEDKAATVAETVSLDASGSTDPDGDVLTYQWSFMSRPRGSRARLVSPDTATPAFLVDRAGRYVVRVVAADGQGRAVDSVNIDVPNTAPFASAGADQTAAVGAAVTLDSTASTDLDGDRLRVTWTILSRPSGSAAALSGRRTMHPSFVVDRPGEYRIRVTVTDGLTNSSDVVVISTVNSPPVANAGPDATARPNQTVRLDASGSQDVDGDPLTFSWRLRLRPDRSEAALSDPQAVDPTLHTDQLGRYEIELLVNDGKADSDPDVVVITVGNIPPVASAGPDQTAAPNAEVTLDGSGSTDVDGDTLLYTWALISLPEGSAAVLSDATAVKPTFVTDLPGKYIAQLVVRDEFAVAPPDTVEIDVAGDGVRPVADAGLPQRVTVRQPIVLDGSGSYDADGDPLTFRWSLLVRPDTSLATITDATAVRALLTPDRPGEYVVQLIVSDGIHASDPVTATMTSTNITPSADAGPDQEDVAVGSSVILDGSASSDPDGPERHYRWSLIARPGGSVAEISDAGAAMPSFSADVAGEYVAQLIIHDGLVDSAPDTVLIRTNRPVHAAAGPDQSVDVGDRVLLDGGGSSDPAGGTLTYQWTLAPPAGSAATLLDASTSGPEFVADLPGVYVVELTVANADGVSATDSVVITARPKTPTLSVIDAMTFADTEVGSSTVMSLRVTNTGELPITFTSIVASGDFSIDSGTSTCLSAPLGASADCTVTVVFTPQATGVRAGVLTITSDAAASPHTISLLGTGIDPEAVPVVTVVATDANASESGPDSGTITVQRSGPTDEALLVNVAFEGTALNGVDYATVAPTLTIPAGAASATVAVTPIADAIAEDFETVILSIASGDYTVGVPAAATVNIADAGTVVTVTATDGTASESSTADGTFTVTRTGPTGIALSVAFTLTGTATNGTDYGSVPLQVTIPAGATSTTVPIVPIDDSVDEATETVILTIAPGAYSVGTPGSAVISIEDNTVHVLVNGANQNGSISVAGETDSWTLTAEIGDTIIVNIGEVGANSAFVPWIRILSPSGAAVSGGNDWGALAAQFQVTAPATGVYRILVASADTGNDATGNYVLTSLRVPGAFRVSPGDEGGRLTNGANHAGTLHIGDLDTWTVTAMAGETLLVNIGQTGTNTDLTPWIRVFGPTGAPVSGGSDWGDLAAQVQVTASTTGTYTVVVSTNDTGRDAAGPYVLTVVHPLGALTVSPGDEGGALTNGANHTGVLHIGDLDAWTVTAAAGETLLVNIGQTGTNTDLTPWIRVFGPTGAPVSGGSDWGDLAAQVQVTASTTGTYTVVVSTNDTGRDAAGPYVLTVVHPLGALTVSPGDEGGALTNGANHTGVLHIGDLDAWTVTAAVGETLLVNIGQTGTNTDLTPWIRVFGPTGVPVSGGSDWGDLAAQVQVTASATGNYTIVVSTNDTGRDAAGHYILTVVHPLGALTVSPGDEGGALTNGANHVGTLHIGDLDTWTLTAVAGEALLLNIGQTGTNTDLTPWIRVFGPTGVPVSGGSDWGDLAAQVQLTAPTTGIYTVVVSTNDTGRDAAGDYLLTVIHPLGALTISPGNEGGPLARGGSQAGSLQLGDLDAWTLTAVAGEAIILSVAEPGPNTALVPWIRVFGPAGTAVSGGNNWGDLSASLRLTAPATGTYVIVVSTNDTGRDAVGNYVIAWD